MAALEDAMAAAVMEEDADTIEIISCDFAMQCHPAIFVTKILTNLIYCYC